METVYTGAEMKPKHNGAYPGAMLPGKPLEYTGDTVDLEVVYVLNGPVYGLAEGWCIMSIVKIV